MSQFLDYLQEFDLQLINGILFAFKLQTNCINMSNLQSQFDLLNIIYQQVQHSISHVVASKHSISNKLQHLQIYLCKFKGQLFQWLHNIVSIHTTSQKDITNLKQKLVQLHSQTDEQLMKHKLHLMLKKKINKLKKQSFINSMMQDQPNHNHQISKQLKIDQTLHQLEKSVILIQKDLKIEADEQEDNHKFDLSSILHRSMASLEQTPSRLDAKDYHNSSIVSEYNIDIHSHIKQYPNYLQQTETVTITTHSEQYYAVQQEQKASILEGSNFLKGKTQLTQEIEQISQYMITSRQVQMENCNINQRNTNNKKAEQPKGDKKQINYRQLEKPPMLKTTVKKKKKSVFSNTGIKNNQNLLGNLLQESYNSFLEDKKSS